MKDTYPSCSGPCNQGRKLCPSPQVCRQPLFTDTEASSLTIAIVLAIASVAVGLCMAGIFGGAP